MEVETNVGQQQAEFDAIPAERTFLEIKLYLVDEGEHGLRPGGMCQYNGDRLKALEIDRILATECVMIHSLAQDALQQIINRAGRVSSLASIFLGEENDNEDSNSSEGSGTEQQSASATS